ncbi:hypothetical protein BU15DRAFT_65642 [Melanogaster broomeanus]|nr:hypothetical protein BU15DRAFT_65642 [Melanogaster broomeanus]
MRGFFFLLLYASFPSLYQSASIADPTRDQPATDCIDCFVGGCELACNVASRPVVAVARRVGVGDFVEVPLLQRKTNDTALLVKVVGAQRWLSGGNEGEAEGNQRNQRRVTHHGLGG